MAIVAFLIRGHHKYIAILPHETRFNFFSIQNFDSGFIVKHLSKRYEFLVFDSTVWAILLLAYVQDSCTILYRLVQRQEIL